MPYYFNRSGNGRGGNAEASAFTKDKTKNPYAYLAAFAPDGTYLDESAIYADKNQAREWLASLLRKHVKFAAWTQEEERVKKRGMAEGASVAERLVLARLYERLASYDDAMATLNAIGKDTRVNERAEIARARMRMQRATEQWEALGNSIKRVREGDEAIRSILAADLDAESLYLLVHQKKHKAAIALGRSVVHRHDANPRATDIHFSLGVASWFAGERDWARFHWMWIWHERRQSRLAMRAKIAAVHETMPYPNPELGGSEYEGNIGTHHIEQEHNTSCMIYRKLRPRYDQKEWKINAPNSAPNGGAAGPTSSGPQSSGDRESPDRGAPSNDPPHDAVVLAQQLRDGNRHVSNNNVLVEKLVKTGAPALHALLKVLNDENYLGRGYATYALGKVMGATKSHPLAAKMALVRGLQHKSDYVRGLSSSGLRASGLTWKGLSDARDAVTAEEAKAIKRAGTDVPWEGDDPAALAKRLRDGNAHRITNNRIVARLQALGRPAIEPLVKLLGDSSFQGRGYAAIALANVLKPLKERPAAAMQVLEKNVRSSDPYIRALTQSALNSLR